MYGAILGDMIGAPYEFDQSGKTKDFPLFSRESQFTDDSVMTIAVAEALLDTLGQDDDAIKAALVKSMQKWGKRYPDAGYGGMFYRWLRTANPKPYGSYGNGSAMRVSSAGWLYDTLEATRHAARLTAEVTHNHPEGIKGAEATASAIYLARTGRTKQEIRDYIIGEFGYDLSRTCDEIRPTYRHIETCQATVPEAITAFLEGDGFEDVIRTAVSLGGDCDTLTCIAGGIAEAFYAIPSEMTESCRARLPEDMLQLLDRFQHAITPMHDSGPDGKCNMGEQSPETATIAKQSDWNTQPMPDQHADFTLNRHLTPEQMACLRRGNIPQEMEDKWFWYMEGNTLYAHRSWTGICVFILRFEPGSDAIRVTVNRNPEQFSSESIREDTEEINHLLDWWTQPHYDYYNEWLSETLRTLKKKGLVPDESEQV